MQKRCNTCQVVLPATEFYDRNKGIGRPRLDHRCRGCESARHNARNAELRAAGKLPKPRVTPLSTPQKRIANLRHMFRMTAEDYQALLAKQGGGCGICGLPEPEPYGLGVDHDHSCCFEKNLSGSYKRTCGYCVRGLLCTPCNTGLGVWRDDKARLYSAVSYLESWEARRG